jgi:hypothetical protein
MPGRPSGEDKQKAPGKQSSAERREKPCIVRLRNAEATTQVRNSLENAIYPESNSKPREGGPKKQEAYGAKKPMGQCLSLRFGFCQTANSDCGLMTCRNGQRLFAKSAGSGVSSPASAM